MTSRIVMSKLVLSELPGGITNAIQEMKMKMVEGINVRVMNGDLKRLNCMIKPPDE
jgi:hypothetical protein